jgi:hypothetical protein
MMRDDLLEPLADSECRKALVFIDACAEKFREVVESRDVISNLDADEVEEFLDSGWYLGVFLSCSPGEKSYPAASLGHGLWTHFVLEAMSGRADRALTRDRWLTDGGLRDYLRVEVPRFMTREMQVRGTQTPQAILSGTNTFRIRHVPRPPAVPADAALAGIQMRNNSEFLEGSETGAIRQLDGFQRGYHTVPTQLSDSAESWCHRLLTDRVAEELQDLYQSARSAFKARRKDLRKEDDGGSGDLDTPAFRYSIETGQNPEDPAEYVIRRRLELRQGWAAHRAAIDELFGSEFDRRGGQAPVKSFRLVIGEPSRMTRTRAIKAALPSLRLRSVIVPMVESSFGTRDFIWYIVPNQVSKSTNLVHERRKRDKSD